MLRITDTDFLPAAFGVQTNRFVRKDREADHTFISDNFDAVFAGGSWATKHHEPLPTNPLSNWKQALSVSSAG